MFIRSLFPVLNFMLLTFTTPLNGADQTCFGL